MSSTHHFILFQRLPLMYGRVPKVANSSIKAALCRLLNTPPEEGVRTTADSFWREATHGETDLITPAQARHNRGTHFSFSFVRNPFDRLVSAYNNKLIENEELTTPMQAMGLHRHMPFAAFADRLCACSDEELDVHLLPQSSILCAGDKLVPKFVGRMEQMDEHWAALQRRMRREGLATLGKLPQKNMRRGSQTDLSSYYNSTDLITKISNRYQRDLELFYADTPVGALASGQPLQPRPPCSGAGAEVQPDPSLNLTATLKTNRNNGGHGHRSTSSN